MKSTASRAAGNMFLVKMFTGEIQLEVGFQISLVSILIM